MAAPEWYGSNPGTVAAPNLVRHTNDSAHPSFNGVTQPLVTDGLMHVSAEVLKLCGSFFDPVVLAQFDSALAHELAQQAQRQSLKASEVVDLPSAKGAHQRP